MVMFGSHLNTERKKKHAEQEKLNFMDRTTRPVKKDSSELTRELLIAISESGPDKLVNSSPAREDSNLSNGHKLSTKEIVADKLRADLISISYSPSDKIALPATGPQDG